MTITASNNCAGLVWLHEHQHLSKNCFGSKASNLVGAISIGLKIPLGIALSADAVSLIVEISPKKDNESLFDMLSTYLEDLPKPWIIRSSSLEEDSPTKALSGVFNSIGNIVSIEMAHQAIHEIYIHAHSSRILKYLDKTSTYTTKIKMGILIQHMINPMFSGVAFSKNPISGANEVLIEVAKGANEALVNGKLIPDTIVVPCQNKKDGLVDDIEIVRLQGKKPLLSFQELKSIARIAWVLEDHFRLPQDIEWAIHNDEIFILQTRPLCLK